MTVLILIFNTLIRLVSCGFVVSFAFTPINSFASVSGNNISLNLNTSRFVQTNPLVGQPNIFDGEIVAPTQNFVKAHTLGVSYKVLPQVALKISLPYSDKTADIISTIYPNFRLIAKGFGDVNLSSNFQVISIGKEKFYIDLALSLPTGSVTKKNDTPFGKDQLLPFALQPGSGTYDIGVKTIYANSHDEWSWGGQLSSLTRIGKNERGFSLGDRYGFNIWAGHNFAAETTLVVSLSGVTFGNIDVIDLTTVSTISQKFLAGGKRLDLECVLSLKLPEKILNNCSFNIKYMKPLYQKRDAPFEVSHNISAGVQLNF